jgi:hypothetical protein
VNLDRVPPAPLANVGRLDAREHRVSVERSDQSGPLDRRVRRVPRAPSDLRVRQDHPVLRERPVNKDP